MENRSSAGTVYGLHNAKVKVREKRDAGIASYPVSWFMI